MKKKASKGRPKKAASIRTAILAISITPKRRKKIKQCAKQWGVSVSEAIGMLIDEVH